MTPAENVPDFIGDRRSATLVLFLVTPLRTNADWTVAFESDLRKSGVVLVKMTYAYLPLKSFRMRDAQRWLQETTLSYSQRYPGRRFGFVGIGFGGLIVKKFLLSNPAVGVKIVILVGTPAHRLPLWIRPFVWLWGGLGRLYDLQLRDLEKEDTEWRRFLVQTPARVIFVVGAYDHLAPYSPSEQWDGSNVWVLPKGHSDVIAGSAIMRRIAEAVMNEVGSATSSDEGDHTPSSSK
jgi:hypothetical protein